MSKSIYSLIVEDLTKLREENQKKTGTAREELFAGFLDAVFAETLDDLLKATPAQHVVFDTIAEQLLVPEKLAELRAELDEAD